MCNIEYVFFMLWKKDHIRIKVTDTLPLFDLLCGLSEWTQPKGNLFVLYIVSPRENLPIITKMHFSTSGDVNDASIS